MWHLSHTCWKPQWYTYIVRVQIIWIPPWYLSKGNAQIFEISSTWKIKAQTTRMIFLIKNKLKQTLCFQSLIFWSTLKKYMYDYILAICPESWSNMLWFHICFVNIVKEYRNYTTLTDVPHLYSRTFYHLESWISFHNTTLYKLSNWIHAYVLSCCWW